MVVRITASRPRSTSPVSPPPSVSRASQLPSPSRVAAALSSSASPQTCSGGGVKTSIFSSSEAGSAAPVLDLSILGQVRAPVVVVTGGDYQDSATAMTTTSSSSSISSPTTMIRLMSSTLYGLISGRLVREKVDPAVQLVVRSQINACSGLNTVQRPPDLFEIEGTNGMPRASICKLPDKRVTEEYNWNGVGDLSGCSVCLQSSLSWGWRAASDLLVLGGGELPAISLSWGRRGVGDLLVLNQIFSQVQGRARVDAVLSWGGEPGGTGRRDEHRTWRRWPALCSCWVGGGRPASYWVGRRPAR